MQISSGFLDTCGATFVGGFALWGITKVISLKIKGGPEEEAQLSALGTMANNVCFWGGAIGNVIFTALRVFTMPDPPARVDVLWISIGVCLAFFAFLVAVVRWTFWKSLKSLLEALARKR
jgi:hypothetical protein